MVRVVQSTACLLGFYALISLFKPRLWILVILMIENTQILSFLSILESFNYEIYSRYSYYLQMTPGNINLFNSGPPLSYVYKEADYN